MISLLVSLGNVLLWSGVVLVGLTLLIRLAVIGYAKPRSVSATEAPAMPAAIIFGAGLRTDGTPTAVLRDRVETGAALYRAGKVQKLLLSGDNRFVDYNEPESMRQYALQLGIPDEDIVLDYAGRRTYDSCYRAKHIFQLSQVLLVTQPFHLPRAVLICNQLGLPSTGVYADNHSFLRRSIMIWTLRELPATVMAVWESMVTKPEPTLGDPEPIFPQ